MFAILWSEAKKLARQPRRLLEALRPRRWRQLLSIPAFDARTGGRWKAAGDTGGFKRREYATYEDYVRHQQSKFGYLDLADYDREYRLLLRERLQGLDQLRPGATVLCLGARQGTEVKSFLDLGCFAVGVDLNPGKNNRWVLTGDFHNLQFATGSVEVVFSNSFDHAFDAEKLLGEIRRVLRSNGVLIVEAIQGEAQDMAPDHYASFWWRRIDDLADLLSRHGFELIRRSPFAKPWPGEQLCFQMTSLKDQPRGNA
jgi:SAM-dependent methyltransferase